MRTINENNRTIKVGKEQTEFRNELALLEREVAYFEDALNDLKTHTIGDPAKALKVAKFVTDTHHYKRVVERITKELNQIHHEIAEEVQGEAKINKESYKDHQYFRKEMEDLRVGYKEYKYSLRTFVASFEHLTNTDI
jgi:hypothetical protein